jgi:hypothetical protein
MGTIQGFRASNHAKAICAAGRTFCRRNLPEQADQCHVGLDSFRRKAGHDRTEVGAIELSVPVYLAGEKAGPQSFASSEEQNSLAFSANWSDESSCAKLRKLLNGKD